MKRRKPTKPGPPTQEERAFQQRVRKAIARSSGTLYAFQKTRGIPKATVRGWLRERAKKSGELVRPRLPYSPQLLTFARVTGSNLHHLLTGEGPEYVGDLQPRAELAVSLRQHVVAALASRAGLPAAAVDFIVSPPEELLQDVVAQYRVKAMEYPAIVRKALAQAMAQGRGRPVQKAIAELRHWLGLKPGAGGRFRRQDVGVRVRTAGDAGAPVPAGTFGHGVLDAAAYRAEAPARRAVEKRLSATERRYLKDRDRTVKRGERARAAEVKARGRRGEMQQRT